ncbi:hypothetical protein NDU88_003027 [Pleurodeles waltl]|uniref:Uncharacterized protein n=1 Tax=Pleurodeles waltl TaxID=8319 RepID=A0AAV7T4C7_PLEWA|nr:hypothetical protein NDU88_003027 [Pleurodeles waltl]
MGPSQHHQRVPAESQRPRLQPISPGLDAEAGRSPLATPPPAPRCYCAPKPPAPPSTQREIQVKAIWAVQQSPMSAPRAHPGCQCSSSSARGAHGPTKPTGLAPLDVGVSRLKRHRERTAEPSVSKMGEGGRHLCAPQSAGVPKSKAIPAQIQPGERRAQCRLHSLRATRRLRLQASNALRPHSDQSPPRTVEPQQTASGSRSRQENCHV